MSEIIVHNEQNKSENVDPRSLVFSPWNVNTVSPENQRKLVESIKRNGIFRPIVVCELQDGSLQVIAGEHTTRAAVELGLETIAVYNLGPISEKKAKEISVIDNQHYGHEDTFGLSELLREFDGDVEAFLPMTDEDLKTLFKASTINFDDLDLPESSHVDSMLNPDDALAAAPITHQLLRFRVPLGDAEFVQRCIENIIKREGFSGSDSLTNAGDALVQLCRGA